MMSIHGVLFGTFPIREYDIPAQWSVYLCHTHFDNSVGTGGWSLGGVTTDLVDTTESGTIVLCSSTHLTSFAVLVDVTGQRVSFSPQHAFFSFFTSAHA